MARIHALTKDELAAIGDSAVLRAAINAELRGFGDQLLDDGHGWYDDAKCHELIDARLAALPETGPERTAIQRTYELLKAIIDDGVADTRSDDELLYWLDELSGVRRGDLAPEQDAE
jgi:hypothetical protein